MPKPKALIQVFEWGFLPLAKSEARTGAGEISHTQWEALGAYNTAHGNAFFTLQTNGIRFHQFVGVIQVGNLTIEVLPKIDKKESEEQKILWQGVLVEMLRQCHWMQQHAHQQAPLRIRRHSILDAYLELFLHHCEAIIHRGLVKRYRKTEGNKHALKGKLLFAQQLCKNTFHEERFFTRHTSYDAHHPLNQILLKALRLIPVLSPQSALRDKAGRLLLDFPELPDVQVSPEVFDRIRYDRKTTHYREAIDIAAMLLLRYRPDLSSGHRHVLAILFDMNELWEEYIFRQLRKQKDYHVQPQQQKKFWQPVQGSGYKVIRPDIVLTHRERNKVLILDTKWKLPDGRRPADADLKQMFAYNEFWQAAHALLLYPDKAYREILDCTEGGYCPHPSSVNLSRHGCSMLWVSVLKHQQARLDNDIGRRIIDFLEAKGWV